MNYTLKHIFSKIGLVTTFLVYSCFIMFYGPDIAIALSDDTIAVNIFVFSLLLSTLYIGYVGVQIEKFYLKR